MLGGTVGPFYSEAVREYGGLPVCISYVSERSPPGVSFRRLWPFLQSLSTVPCSLPRQWSSVLPCLGLVSRGPTENLSLRILFQPSASPSHSLLDSSCLFSHGTLVQFLTFTISLSTLWSSQLTLSTALKSAGSAADPLPPVLWGAGKAAPLVLDGSTEGPC